MTLCFTWMPLPVLLSLKKPQSLILFPPATGKSVLAKPDGGTIPLKGCWHGTAGHTVYYIFTTARSQLVVDSCLGSIFRWRVHSAEAPWGHRVRGLGQGGLSLPWWKNTVAEVLAVLEGLLSRYTEGYLRVCVDWTSLCSRHLILTLLGLNWLNWKSRSKNWSFCTLVWLLWSKCQYVSVACRSMHGTYCRAK